MPPSVTFFIVDCGKPFSYDALENIAGSATGILFFNPLVAKAIGKNFVRKVSSIKISFYSFKIVIRSSKNGALSKVSTINGSIVS